MTPKSSAIYNYLSTHGETGFNDKELNELTNNFCQDIEKYKYDYGYQYEDLTTLHFNEIIDGTDCKKYPTVMYYINNLLKIKNNKLINLPKCFLLW